MALKISEMVLRDGHAEMGGFLDEKPFSLTGSGKSWTFNIPTEWKHDIPAMNISCLAEARMAAYAAVAAFRNQARGIGM